MSTNTYAGTQLSGVASTPATNDQAGFEALTFITGGASLRQVPSVGRTWNTVSEDLVDTETNTDVKASSKYKPMDFPVAIKPGDALHAVLRGLEEDRTAVGSFKLALPGDLGTIYVQAQVSMFDEIGGGGQDAIVDANVQLLPQAKPIYVAAP